MQNPKGKKGNESIPQEGNSFKDRASPGLGAGTTLLEHYFLFYFYPLPGKTDPQRRSADGYTN